MAHNSWCSPGQASWKPADDMIMKKFFNDNVLIDQEEWKRNCVCVNVLLASIEDKLKNSLADVGIRIQPFVRAGSCREGTKVRHADEFDIVLPFKFSQDTDYEIVVSPADSVPPGLAKIRLLDAVNDKLMTRDHKGQSCMNSKFFHDECFKSLLDKAIVGVQDKKMTLNDMILQISDPNRARGLRSMLRSKNVDGNSVGLDVKGRVSNQPALTLKMEIKNRERSGKVNTVNVDFVPAFQIKENSREFLVSKWVSEKQNEKAKANLPDPDQTWRISHMHQELGMCQKKGGPKWLNRRSRYLKTSLMSLKALKELDFERNAASQFSNVVKSYDLKNINMYLRHYVREKELEITNTSQALALHIFFLQQALDKKCLTQFFSDPDMVQKYFPGEAHLQAGEKHNLFAERPEEALHQAKLDLEKCLDHFGMTGVIDPFLKLNRLYERDVLESK